MTPEQKRQVAEIKPLVERMRAGGADDRMIRAGLIAAGWAAGAVVKAMEEKDA